MKNTLDLRPGQGAGPFRLGDTLWQVIDHLRANHTAHPKFSLHWDTASPQTADIFVRLPHLVLFFPPSQRLAYIDVPALPTSPLTLTYDKHVLSTPARPMTRGGIAKFLGPTHASDKGRLGYPGISFWVAEDGGRDGAVESVRVELKEGGEIEYADDEYPDGLASCVVLPNKGVDVRLPPVSPDDEPRDITIEVGRTMAQDLLMDLGAPVREYFKEDDRLRRMWGSKDGAGAGARGPTQVFWNYFNLGLDFLVVGETVEKIVAHSNVPGTPLFQQYARCPWTLSTAGGDLDATSTDVDFAAHFGGVPSAGVVQRKAATSGRSKRRAAARKADDDDDADVDEDAEGGRADAAPSAASQPGKAHEEAMVLDRTVEGGLEGVLGVGPSRLIGYPGLIIEEDQESGAICSVLVFKE